MSKARDLADSAQEINILDGKSFLDEDNLASDSATGIASQQSIKAYVDGITTTNITSTGALNSGSITSGFGNIDNGSSNITTTGTITGGSFVIGSADINENDLESIDGITAGTVSASKAVVVNTNKDITGFRNITATGTISGTVSGSISSTTTATTQAESDDSTKIATTEYVSNKITTLIGGAPSTLNDLNELAAAINDDANYNSTLTTALGTKLPKAGGTMTGDLSFGDNNKAIFGAGSDLQIFHDGSHSYVKDAGTGNLKIQGENVAIENTSGDLALYYVNTGINLYHNGSSKLATTSTGINVTGTVTSDGLTVDGTTQVDNYGSTSGKGRIQFGNSGQKFIEGFDTGNAGSGSYLKFGSGSTTQMTLNNSGNVGIGTDSPVAPISVLGATSNTLQATISGGSGGTSRGLHISTATTGQSSNDIVIFDCPISTGTLVFDTNSVERMRIDSSGNVGIGTSSPSSNLHIKTSVDNSLTQGLIIERSANSDKGYINYQAGAFQIRATDGDPIAFGEVSNERMRIDSSGNLLVGKTTTAIGTAGHRINGLGYHHATRAMGSNGTDPVFVANILNNNGNAIEIYKDSSKIGGIQVRGNTLSIGSDDVGLEFHQNDDTVYPKNFSTNAVSHNSISLGGPNHRFKNGYFAGNLYGDGSNLTGVGGSTAYDAVGTYISGLLYHPTQINPGATKAGSQIRACEFGGTSSSAYTMSGTWRMMGYISQGYRGVLWVRIS